MLTQVFVLNFLRIPVSVTALAPFFKNLFYLYLFLAALGLRCCVRALTSGGEQGLLFVAMHGLLTAMASLVAKHGL